MYKYQRHLTLHQKYINNVQVKRWFNGLDVVIADDLNDWFDEHAKELHDMFVALG